MNESSNLAKFALTNSRRLKLKLSELVEVIWEGFRHTGGILTESMEQSNISLIN